MLVDSVLTPPGALCICGEEVGDRTAYAIPTDDDTADEFGKRLICQICLDRLTAEELTVPAVSDLAVKQWLEGVSP